MKTAQARAVQAFGTCKGLEQASWHNSTVGPEEIAVTWKDWLGMEAEDEMICLPSGRTIERWESGW